MTHEHEWRLLSSTPGVQYCDTCEGLRDLAPAHHAYRLMRNPNTGWVHKIDIGIASVVQILWECGVDTHGSCQGGCAGKQPLGKAVIQYALESHERVMEVFTGFDAQYPDPESFPVRYVWLPTQRCEFYDAELEIIGGQDNRNAIR